MDERLFALQDANWNVTGITNTSGTIQERYTETPYGAVTFRDGSGSTVSVSTKGWDILHQGAKADIIGDYDFRNRVYSPTLGLWLSNDPLGFEAGDVNVYRYVGNGPGNELDPTGEIWPLLVVGGMALGWLLADPPPAQAPTEPGETVVPPPNPGEKVGGVVLGAVTGLIAVGVLEGGTFVIGRVAAGGTTIAGGIYQWIVKKKTTIPKGTAPGNQPPNVPNGQPSNAPKGIEHLPKSQQSSVRSFQEKIADHQKKLADYLKDPDRFDNKGFLKNAPTPEIRQNIIEGRARHLQNEIRGWQDQIDKIMGGN